VGESEQCESVRSSGAPTDGPLAPEARRPSLHVAETPAAPEWPPGTQAFEPWYGSGVDVAGAYSRSAWRERLSPGVWEVWVTLGRRLRVDGGFAVRPCDLVRPAVPAGGEDGGGADAVDEDRLAALDEVVHAALVELALNGLARRTDDGAWQVRPNCPISPPRIDKSYTVTHYEHLAAAAAQPTDADPDAGRSGPPTDPTLRPVDEPPPEG
jgi:hypothetical protein